MDHSTNTEPITIYLKSLQSEILLVTLPPAYSVADLARLAYEADPAQFPMPQTTFFSMMEGQSLLDLHEGDMIGSVITTGIVPLMSFDEQGENTHWSHHTFRVYLSEDTHEHVFESYSDAEFEEDILRIPVTLRITRMITTKIDGGWFDPNPIPIRMVYYFAVMIFHTTEGDRKIRHSYSVLSELLTDTEPFTITLQVPSKGFCDFSFCLKPSSLQFVRSLLPAEWEKTNDV